MRVFVAGHLGTVGSALLRRAPENHEILVRRKEELNLEDYDEVFSFLRDTRPDAILMSAAKVGGIAANMKEQSKFLLSNLKLQNAILEAGRNLGINKVIFLGSSCIYPKYAEQPISESALLKGVLENSNEGYAISKIAGIKLCEYIFKESGLNFFSLMPTNIYGPNDNFDLRTSHVPAALMRRIHEAKISNAESVVIWGSGKPRREFMHVDDLADACWHMLKLDLGGELINIGTGEDIEISKFAELMAKIIGFKGELIFDVSKPDGTPRKLLDVTKANSLGWQHKINLEEGLVSTYSWFKSALSKGEIRGY